MTKAKISEYDAVAANNTDVNGVNIAENCPPSGMNNMGREIMAALKRFQVGSDSDGVTVGGNLVVSGSSTLSTTSISSADINAGTIDATAIGGSTAAAGSFTTLAASSTLTVTGAGSIQGLTVGRGAGDISTNTAVGASALAANTTGSSNSSFGYQTLASVTTGDSNSGFGVQALNAVTTATSNTALGRASLGNTTTGNYNTAVGRDSLVNNTTASNNTAVGYQAGYDITTGTGNVCIGYLAGKDQFSTSSNNLFIARSNTGAGNAATWIQGDGNGACIQGNNSSSWTTVSDGRLKNIIGDFGKGLDAINQLIVKKFKYKTADEMPDLVRNEFGKLTFEPDSTIEFVGIVAQELQPVIPEAIKENEKGVLQVDSDAVFWATIKAIQELSAKNDALEARIAALEGN
jgi:hypothetical protein